MFNSKVMDLPSGQQLRDTSPDTAKSIVRVADLAQESSKGLKSDFRAIEKVANQELAQPNVTPETSASIDSLVNVARNTLVEGNDVLIEAMQACQNVMGA